LWILKSTLSAGAIRDALKKVIDSDDALSVIQIAPGADWANTANVYKAWADMLT
jgi:hypothetical protein